MEAHSVPDDILYMHRAFMFTLQAIDDLKILLGRMPKNNAR